MHSESVVVFPIFDIPLSNTQPWYISWMHPITLISAIDGIENLLDSCHGYYSCYQDYTFHVQSTILIIQ